MPTNFLPKGCSNLVQGASQGSGLPQQANRLYMLTVQRESLVKKKHALETQLQALQTNLKKVEAELLSVEKRYGKIIRKGSRQRMKFKPDGPGTKKVHLKY